LLAELIPWNLFLGSLKVYKFGLRVLEQKEERWERENDEHKRGGDEFESC
jgi:hypothetical protein